MADVLAGTADLAAYLQRGPFDVVEEPRATLALELATGHCQAVAGQRFLAAADTVTLAGGDEWLALPQRPVTAVTAVTTTELGVGTTRTVNVDYELIGSRLRWLGRGVWPAAVTVAYAHGYPPGAVPQDVRDACLYFAAQRYTNPQGLRSVSIDDWSRTFGGGGTDEAADHKTNLRRYRVPVTSVRLA